MPDSVDRLSGIEFEDLIIHLLTKMGMAVEGTRRTGDGGVDAIAVSHEPIRGGRFVVQCKRQGANVGEPEIRDLYGAMHHERASKGIFVTNSGFTSQARTFAMGKPLDLIDGITLNKLLSQYGLGRGSSTDDNVVRVPKGVKRTSQRLDVIAKRIGITLAKSRYAAWTGKKELDLRSFCDVAGKSLHNIEPISNEVMRVVHDCLNSPKLVASDLDYDWLEARLCAVDSVILDMEKLRIMWNELSVKEECLGVVRAMIGVFDAFLSQFVDFTRRFAGLLDADGKVAQGTYRANLSCTINCENEVQMLVEEVKRLVEMSH